MVQDVPLYPLIFKPVLKDYIWGGRGLARHLGRPLPPQQNIAESWEVAAHPNGDVTVINGPLAGKNLSEISEILGDALIGSRGAWALQRNRFPLLVKLLDASRELSVQVHPGDEYAGDHEGNELGKTEMWVVLHAKRDARVILGLKRGTTREKFRQALEDGALERQLHEIPVRSGDFICVPSGSIHAILGGLLIAEIQQNSDVTYRVYDWNRVGDDGKPRPLHVERAMDVINFDQVEPVLPQARLIVEQPAIRRWELCRNQYFCVERVELGASARYEGTCNGSTLEIWGTIAGGASVESGQKAIDLEAVQFALLPASLGDFSILAQEDHSTLLRAYLT